MQGIQPPGFPEGRRWVRAVMAGTLDGVMRGPDGSSRSISTPADQQWFAALRRQPDVLLVGAGTIRAEDYRPSKKVVAVVTARLDLPLSLRMFRERTAENPRPIALTTAAAARGASPELREVIDVVACGEEELDLARALDLLDARGLRRIQCEGGPHLLSTLLAEDLVDELLLSVTPMFMGGAAEDHVLHVPGGLGSSGRMSVVSLQESEGTAFLQVAAR